MSTKNVTLKEKVNGVLGDTIFPATTTPNVYDSAKSQALSQTLVDTPDYEALGFVKFSTATAYNTGDKVYKDNELYRFIADKTAGEWDVAKVEPWSIEQEIEEVDDAIRSLIPAQASADNKLADKAYVNDKVSTDTATFRGTFNLVTDLELTTEATQGQIATALGTAISGEDKNDYAFVQIPTSDATPTEIARIDRYKYTGLQWAFEYSLNNSGFTAEQWAAINSGITSSLVTAFGAKYDKPAGGIPVSDMNTSTFDDEPTENSFKPAKSGGIWSWVTGLINGIREWANSTFAKIDGWYSTLVAGAAENLVGHGSVSAEYTFRTSGGTADIGTGTATIDVMKGKTLKWNQMVQNGNFADTTIWDAIGATLSVANNVATLTAIGSSIILSQYFNLINGHKYLFKCHTKASNATQTIKISNAYGGTDVTAPKNTDWNLLTSIWTCNSSGFYAYPRIYCTDTVVGDTVQIKNIILVDLTEMGLDSITSVAEFTSLYPLDYYAYTATPVLINNAAKGIVTTGFNQWDEEWESGSIAVDSGRNAEDNTKIRSAGYIPVFPDTDYYIKAPVSGINVYYYRIDKTYITYGQPYNSSYIFRTPSDCYYIRFRLADTTTYNHDICINLSWSGYRNGEYEPYEKHTLYFNGESGSLATVTGKKIVDGEPTGESVTIFPDGMKSAGSVYDFGKVDSDGYIRKVTKKMANLTITNNTPTSFFNVSNASSGAVFLNNTDYKAKGAGQLISTKYDRNTGINDTISNQNDKSIRLVPDGSLINLICIKDTALITSGMTGEQAKTALMGLSINYELNTPEEYLLDTPIPANYIVNDFSTEQRIPEDTASSVMAPILYDVQYSMNAVDAIRRLPVNYISVDSMEQYLAARGTLDGGTWSMSWDSEHERYNFSFTPTEEQQQEGA